MKDISSTLTNKYIWGLTLKESMAVTFLGTLMAVSKSIRIPMHIPGHSGLIWIGILTYCCLRYRKAGSGTLAGITAGFLCTVFVIGDDGPFVFFKYFLPGFSMDILFILVPLLTMKWYLTAFTAAFAHWTKLLCNYIIGTILNVPQGYLIAGVQIATVNHLAFGFAGGWLAYIIYLKTNSFRG